MRLPQQAGSTTRARKAGRSEATFTLVLVLQPGQPHTAVDAAGCQPPEIKSQQLQCARPDPTGQKQMCKDLVSLGRLQPKSPNVSACEGLSSQNISYGFAWHRQTVGIDKPFLLPIASFAGMNTHVRFQKQVGGSRA